MALVVLSLGCSAREIKNAESLLMVGQCQQAQTVLEAFVQRNPADAGAQRLLGDAQACVSFKDKDPKLLDRAIDSLQASLKLDKESVGTALRLAMLLSLKGDRPGQLAAIETQLKIEKNLNNPKVLCMAVDAPDPADSRSKKLSSMMDAASWERLPAYASSAGRSPTFIVTAQSAALVSADDGKPNGTLPKWTVVQGLVRDGEKVFLVDTMNPSYVPRSGYISVGRESGCQTRDDRSCVAGGHWKPWYNEYLEYRSIFDSPCIVMWNPFCPKARAARPINMGPVRAGSVVCEGGRYGVGSTTACKVKYEEIVYLKKWLEAKSVALGAGFLAIDQERAPVLRRLESHVGRDVFERLLSGHLARGLPKAWVEAVTGTISERPIATVYENGEILTTYGVHGMTLTFSDGVLSAWKGELRL
jgi:hypothetical protein